MSYSGSKNINNITLLFFGIMLFCGCSGRNSIKDWKELTESTKPDIVGHNIKLTKSRSGKVQFQLLTTKVVENYKDDKPYIYICPEGLKIKKYDSIMQVKFELTADSAFIIKPNNYYELWGNVTMMGKQDSSKIFTQKMIIDERKNKIHTDTKIVINNWQKMKYAIADGFESDLDLKKIIFKNVRQGMVNYKNFKLKKKDSLQKDK